jgi:hypothetical protein
VILLKVVILKFIESKIKSDFWLDCTFKHFKDSIYLLARNDR